MNFECPACGHVGDIVATRGAIFCGACMTKVETCCEGAPLPERKPEHTLVEEGHTRVEYTDGTVSDVQRAPRWWQR